jgi:hypothetical protein
LFFSDVQIIAMTASWRPRYSRAQVAVEGLNEALLAKVDAAAVA